MRKWRSSSLLPVVLFFLVSAARPQTDILTFVGDVRLPACAYDCVNLYTIQYICSQRGSERKNCFCQDIFSFKQRGWGCDSVCRSTKEIKMVSDFVQTTCNDVFSSLEDSPNSANKTENSTPQSNGVPKDHEGKPTTYSKSKKVANWWCKNWPFFLVAFVVAATAFGACAFTGQFRRYTQKMSTRNRVRKACGKAPPSLILAPSISAIPPLLIATPYSNTQPSPRGIYGDNANELRTPLPQREEIERGHGTRGWPYFSQGRSVSYSEVNALNDYSGRFPPPPRTLFASRTLESSMRQERWGRRLPQHSSRGGRFSWLLFWRKSGLNEKMSTEYIPVNRV